MMTSRVTGALGVLAAASLFALGAAPARADFSLTILHTNDFHSRIEPINKFDSTCGEKDQAEAKCLGGSARLITAIRDHRAAAEAAGRPSLLVDGGDQFQGSLFYTYYKGKAAARLMNELGYQAMTVGNHEFDDGPTVLRGFMDAIQFPILLANADISAEPTLAGALKASTVVEVGGQKIGLIGLTPVDTTEISSPGQNIRFSDPAPALAREVAALEAAGVNKIVVLSHSGYLADQAIAAAAPGVDVIIGGHSHSYLSSTDDKAEGPYPTWVARPDGQRVPIVQAYAYGKFLGELTVTWNDSGDVVAAEGAPVLMDASVAEDAAVKAEIADLAKPLDQIRNQVIAETTAPVEGSRDVCRVQECSMGVLVTEAMLAEAAHEGATIAITNSGGLRASIDGGPVTMGEVLTVLPFQNTLATFKLSGADVIAALESGVAKVEEVAGRFPQVSGLRYTWTKSKPAGEGRILTVEIRDGDGWKPIDPAATYGVVSNNFMRRGGDGYKVFADKAMDAYDFGPSLEDVVARYLDAHRPYTPLTDGRITEQP